MRNIIGGLVIVAGLGFAGIPAISAAPIGGEIRGAVSTGGVIEHVQYERSRYCERLRRACVYKEERGEVGEGNCRRYRRECRVRW
jgi:hypothetical protein